MGGTADAATGNMGVMSKPLSWGMPRYFYNLFFLSQSNLFFFYSDKVCEKLKKTDRQICELTYEKQIDFSTVDLKKLKVKDLKKILSEWDEVCIKFGFLVQTIS